MFGAGYNLGWAGQSLHIFLSWPSLLTFLLTTLVLAAALRLMDDYLDARFDQLAGRTTLAAYLGEGSVIYALLALAIAALVAYRVAISLFFAAYAVGMAGDLRRTLPSGLTGYQEAGLVLIIGIWGIGWAGMAWSLCIMAGWQCFDDYFDLADDVCSNNRNLCRRWGSGEVVMAGMLFAYLACWLSLLLTGLLLLTAVISAFIWQRCDKWAYNQLLAQQGGDYDAT